jgi:hypothetical protein
MHRFKLNGWHRLGLLATAIWLAIVVMLKFEGFPTEESWRQEYLDRSAKRYREVTNTFKAQYEDCKEQSSKYQDAEQIIQWSRCLKAYGPSLAERIETASAERIRDEDAGEKQLQDHIQSAQRDYLFDSFLLFVAPVLAMFLLMYSILWVRRGFLANGGNN